MLENYYEELKKLINKDVSKNQQPSIKTDCDKTFSVNAEERLLLIDNKIFSIPWFFNTPNLCKNDTKTVDYVLSYFGYDYKDYKMI